MPIGQGLAEDKDAPEVARDQTRKGFGVGAVVGRRALVLLVAAVMAVMMSMGPALAFHGSGGGGGGGQGGGPNGGDGGGAAVQHKHTFKKHHNKLCLVRDRWGDLFWVRCVR
jgi:hypothetical protein